MTDPRHLFESPALLLKWAHKNVDRFDQACNAFLAENRQQLFAEYDAEANESAVVAKFPSQPTEELRELAHRAIVDLRSALDQAVHASAKLLLPQPQTRTVLRRAIFPFCENEAALNSQFGNPKGPFAGVPAELHGLITDAQPYPRPDLMAAKGNPLLHLLSDLANPQKHEALLEVGPDSPVVIWYMPPPVGGQMLMTTHKRAEGEYELLRLPGGPITANHQFGLTACVCFRQVSGESVFDAPGVLRDIGKIGEKIVLGIEEASLKALAARG